MKTKFSAILDIRYKALQSHERKMMQHNLLITQKQAEIDAFMRDVGEVHFPKSGDFGAYIALADTRDRLLTHIDGLHRELSQIKAQAKALREEYKHISIEYENTHCSIGPFGLDGRFCRRNAWPFRFRLAATALAAAVAGICDAGLRTRRRHNHMVPDRRFRRCSEAVPRAAYPETQ